MNKTILYTLGVVLILVAAFFLLNSYIYNEKQGVTVNVQDKPIVPIAENPEGEADPSRMTLQMKTWDWVNALYNDERVITPKKSNAFTVTFKNDGTFSAKTDCNSMSGTYTANDGKITFGPIAMTKMYCEGSQEREFAQLLENASGYHFTGRGQLILDQKFDSGTATFR